MEAGADDFLTKPFDSTELLIRLRTISRLNRFRHLSEERARFEGVVAFSPDGIVIMDSEYKILLANREFMRMGGLTDAAEAIGEDFMDWLTSPDGDLLRNAIDSNTDRTKTASVEVKIAGDAENEPRLVEITVGRLPWQGREAIQLVLRDNTEKKRLESQVMHFQRIELLGELAGSIAHDMNNVLGAVSGNLDLIDLQMEPPEPVKQRMATIRQSLQRGNAILRQLLSFARGSDGQLQDVDLHLAINEVVDLLTPMMKYNYNIEVTVSEDLPKVTADPNQLHQVLMNLCINARDAMPEGGSLSILAQRVSISPEEVLKLGPSAKAGDFAVLHVRDTGSGMPPEVQAKIFAPFFTTKAPGKGTGLGLATVLRIMRHHKGFVLVDSVINQGTCFSCYLPLA